jgi:uncharacterized protein
MMNAKNPYVVDLFAFIRDRQQLEGELQLTASPLLADAIIDNPPESTPLLRWTATGAARKAAQPGSIAKPCLHLVLEGEIWLECQRCLGAYRHPLAIETRYRVFRSNQAANAAAVDEQYEDIVGTAQFNLIRLIEEEVLLSLPWAPKHPTCPEGQESLDSISRQTGEK